MCLSVLFNLNRFSLKHFLTLTCSKTISVHFNSQKYVSPKRLIFEKVFITNLLQGNQLQNKKNYCRALPQCQWEIWMNTRFLSILFQSVLKQVTGGWILFQHQSGKGVEEESEWGSLLSVMLTVYMENFFFFFWNTMSVSILMLLQIWGWGRFVFLGVSGPLCIYVTFKKKKKKSFLSLCSVSNPMELFCAYFLQRFLKLIWDWLAIFSPRYLYHRQILA